MRYVWAPFGFILEPSFIEIKFVLLAYFASHPNWVSALTLIAGILFCLAAANIIAYYEGTKSLWSLSHILREAPVGTFAAVELVPAAELAKEYGFSHQAFKIGPLAQEAGDLIVINDVTRKTWICVCAFNMFGPSYLLLPSGGVPLNDLPLVQRFLALHELGHGSLAGGEIWIRPKMAIVSACVSALFAISVAHVTWLGWITLCLMGLIALVYARKVNVESEAEGFADRYALTGIARVSVKASIELAEDLSQRIERQMPTFERYDQLIGKWRLQNLTSALRQLRKLKTCRLDRPMGVENVIIKNWFVYAVAILMFAWVYLNPRDNGDDAYILAAVFAVLIIACFVVRVKTASIMLSINRSIKTLLKAARNGR
jgi:hypothetical protein